jgi:cobalamin biosynthetic protein CobC
VSAGDILAFGDQGEADAHGGDLAAARALFPGAPEPFIDLSTGINPHPHPLPRFSAAIMARLPAPDAVAQLRKAAARFYGAPSFACVVPAPGTQILLPLIAGLMPPGRAAVLGPTYSEFARAAALAGQRIVQGRELADAADADLAFICHPNNPDGRLYAREDLIALGKRLGRRSGLLVVDEAFMDVGPDGASAAAEVCRGNIVVLRSFGKFFGLAGIRLGFALAAPPLAERLAALLGPWAVSGPALAVGTRALCDSAWVREARTRLAKAARELDALLIASGLKIVGGTDLFRLARMPAAGALFDHLGRAGIFVRAFAGRPDWLRFGLPANRAAWRRLQVALASFRSSTGIKS